MKVFVHSVAGAGHAYACVGMAQAIAARGHQVVFLMDEIFIDKVTPFGFETIALKPAPADEQQAKEKDEPKEHPFREIGKKMIEVGLLANKNSYDKLELFDTQNQHSLFEKAMKDTIAYDPQFEEAIKVHQPDLIIVDNFLICPSIVLSKIPYVEHFSANPLSVFRSNQLPPACSGLPMDADEEVKQRYRKRLLDTMGAGVNKNITRIWQEVTGGPPPPNIYCYDGFGASPYLNIYGYPEELDYKNIVPPPSNIISVDAFFRTVPGKFELPAEFKAKIKPGDKLIYFSMGSMGSANTDMVNRILELVADSRHKFIVSTGPLHEDVKLPENAWGEAFLPQTKVLALVDLVITHGGNNTVTESFILGKPMIVMPLFGDQWDNATRVQKTGFGVQMNPFECTKEELNGTIGKLLHDEELAKRLKAAADRIATSNSKEKAVIELEKLVEKHRK